MYLREIAQLRQQNHHHNLSLEKKSSHKVDVISHNTLVSRSFFIFSQNKFAEDLICDGMEIDLNYSKGGKLISSHGKQSYFGIINPFARAAYVEDFVKLMPAILKRNQY